MPRIRERIYIQAKDMPTLEDAATFGTGAPAITEVTGLATVGIQIDATADRLVLAQKLPFFLDPDFDLGFRINWITGSIIAANDVLWLLNYALVKVDAAFVAEGSITGALDTVIASDTVGDTTQYGNRWTARGELDKDSYSLTRAELEAGTWIQMKITPSTVDVDMGSELIWILGIEMDFVRRDFVGSSGLEEGLTSEN